MTSRQQTMEGRNQAATKQVVTRGLFTTLQCRPVGRLGRTEQQAKWRKWLRTIMWMNNNNNIGVLLVIFGYVAHVGAEGVCNNR